MNRKIKLLIILSVFIFTVFIAMPVNAAFLSDKTETIYDNSNGLITSEANAICQTEDGYMWIGQYAGLTRYDSRSMITYTAVGDYSLTGVLSLACYGNELYVGTQKGLFVYINKNFTLIEIEGHSHNYCVNDIEIYDDNVYLATDNGLYLYSRSQKAIINTLSTLDVTDVTVYNNNLYFLATGDDNIKGIYDKNGDLYVSRSNLKSIYMYENILYLGLTTGSIIVLNYSIETEYEIIANSQINHMLMDNDILYIASNDGLYFLKNGNITSAENLECSSEIEDMIFDYEGNLWLASTSMGVCKITKSDLSDYLYDYSLPEIYSNAISKGINAIEKYNGYTYIATEKGLVITDESTSQVITNNLTAALTENISGAIRIRDLAVYNDKLYVATYDTNIYDLVIYDGTNITNISGFQLVEEGVSEEGAFKAAGQIRCLCNMDGSLLVGTNYGISKITDDEIENKVLTNRPLYIYFGNDTIYMCLENKGINTLPSDFSGSATSIDPSKNYSALKCLYIESESALVFNDNNVLYYYKDGTVNEIDVDLVGSVCEILFLNGKYYIGTTSKIYVFDDLFSDDLSYETITKLDGLKKSLSANTSGYYDSNEQKYYFASIGGIYVYDIAINESSAAAIKVALNSITVDNDVYYDNNIEISKNSKRVTIDFAVLSYSLDTDYQIFYKLDGFDDDYQELSYSDAYKIIYANLEGGEYTFNLKIVDSYGNAGYNEINLVINKDKLIYEYYAFWIILSVLAATILGTGTYFYIRFRIRGAITRQNEYKAITLESIEAIARTIDAKDSYTNGHSMRVGQYSKLITEALGFSKEEVDNIYYIALLHDIGKIAIPDGILNKPGRLTEEEFDIMKTHTTHGYKILEGISTIPNMAEGARYHHERYNGTGYPDGLKGEEIPYVARIIACCDTFDAMATRRVYKEPYTIKKIISEFENARDTQLDSKIVDIVIKLINEGKLKKEKI